MTYESCRRAEEQQLPPTRIHVNWNKLWYKALDSNLTMNCNHKHFYGSNMSRMSHLVSKEAVSSTKIHRIVPYWRVKSLLQFITPFQTVMLTNNRGMCEGCIYQTPTPSLRLRRRWHLKNSNDKMHSVFNRNDLTAFCNSPPVEHLSDLFT